MKTNRQKRILIEKKSMTNEAKEYCTVTLSTHEEEKAWNLAQGKFWLHWSISKGEKVEYPVEQSAEGKARILRDESVLSGMVEQIRGLGMDGFSRDTVSSLLRKFGF